MRAALTRGNNRAPPAGALGDFPVGVNRHTQPRYFLTLSKACCYGSNRMLRNSRRYLLLLLAVLALGYFLYKFRSSITLQGFRWGMVGESIRQARVSLLFLSLVTIYVCHAVRAVRWVRFCRWLGGAHLRKRLRRHADGLHLHVSSWPGRGADPPRVDCPKGFAFDAVDVRGLCPRARLRYGSHRAACGIRASVIRARWIWRPRRRLDDEGRSLGGSVAAYRAGGRDRVPRVLSLSRRRVARDEIAPQEVAHGLARKGSRTPRGIQRRPTRNPHLERSCCAQSLYSPTLGLGRIRLRLRRSSVPRETLYV
jgi:hypothetical protein